MLYQLVAAIFIFGGIYLVIHCMINEPYDDWYKEQKTKSNKRKS